MTSAFGCVLLQKRNFHLLRCNGNWNYVNWSCDVIHCLMNLRLHCAALPLSFLILSGLIWDTVESFFPSVIILDPDIACLGNDFRDIERMFVQFRIQGKPFQNLFLISVRKRMSCLFITHFLLNLFRFFARETIFLFDPRKSAMDVTARIAATPAATAITIFSIWRSFKRLLTQFFEPSIFLNKIWNEMVEKGTCKTHVFCQTLVSCTGFCFFFLPHPSVFCQIGTASVLNSSHPV